MRTHVSVLFLLLFALISCQKPPMGKVTTSNSPFMAGTTLTKSIDEDAILDEQTGLYLIPNKDVYELSNVQREYERLTSATDRLLPTHQAVKLIPRDDATAHKLLSDTTMWVSRIPFGWRPVGQKKKASSHHRDVSMHNKVIEECGVSDVINDAGTPPVITPLYARWPVGKSLPSDASYEILYDIYTPSANTPIDSLLSETLAPNISTRGVRPDAGNHPAWMDPWSLRIRFFDNVLHSFVDAKNIHVHYIDYSTGYSNSLATNSSGKVFVPENVPMSASVFLEFYTNDFKVTENNSPFYFSEYIATVDDLTEYPYDLVLGSPVTPVTFTPDFMHQVFQSAYHYYKRHNDLLDNIEKMHLDSPLRIAAYPDSASLRRSGNDVLGCFYPYASPQYIEIANYESEASFIFGTVLHELGHASHFTELGPSSFSETKRRIKESFASFMGWYNVKHYYSSELPTDAFVHEACSQGRQNWPLSSNYYYTPIFVDLIDDYNQSILENASCVNDAISGVPVTDIISFAIGPETWAESLYLMQQKVGILYTATEFNNLVALY